MDVGLPAMHMTRISTGPRTRALMNTVTPVRINDHPLVLKDLGHHNIGTSGGLSMVPRPSCP